ELVLGRPGREILAVDEGRLFADLSFELGLRPDDLDAHRRACFFAAESAAATMLGYAPQRQRLPLTARRTSSALGGAFRSRRATPTGPGPTKREAWGTPAC